MDINVGLVGYGYWGKNYLPNLKNIEGISTSWVCDEKNKPKDKDLPIGTKYTSSYEDILNDHNTNAVLIVTPSETHFPLAVQALGRGKHIFIEKPITTKVSEAEELCEIAKNDNRVLMVGHIFKFNPAFTKLKSLVEQGDIGDLKYIETRRVGLGPVRQDVSALWDLLTHDIYMTLALTKSLPETVSYQGISHNGKVDDIVSLNMKFPRNIFSTFYANWEHPTKERKFIVGGKDKTVTFDDIQPTEKIRIDNKGVSYQPVDGNYGTFQTAIRDGDTHMPFIKQEQPLLKELNHFFACIRGEKCLSDGYDGLNTVRVLEAAERSREAHGLETRL